MSQQQYKYFAFISYSSKDTEWGKRLQRKLEHYRMPATLCREHGWERKPINPVFFAPTDIQPGGLTAELQERLRASKNLIVICSPHSAQSEWVGKEIAFFHGLGRTERIHFFIVDGKPHSGNPATECFNPIVDTLGLPEILGANIHEKTQTYPFTTFPWPWMNRERAYVQLISKLLGIEFDAIWQRHKRLLLRQTVAWIAGVVMVLAALLGVWMNSQPFAAEMSLNEKSVHSSQLPPLKDAVVTLTLDNETKNDTIKTLDGTILFTNIPHRFLNNQVRVHVEAHDFQPVDTTILLTGRVSVDICRNPDVYGDIHFQLWKNERGVANTRVTVDGYSAVSDSEGYVKLSVPLENQKPAYPVSAEVPLRKDTLYMPCGPNDIIEIK